MIARRFPPPWTAEFVMSPLSHNVSMAAAIFSSFSQTNFSKKIVAPRNLSEKGTNR
jgi:hypothetical protein